MMMMSRGPRRRWPRSEQFVLSASGREAAARYLEVIVASRSDVGRSSFDVARQTWADAHGLGGDDGPCLRELVDGPLTLAALVEGLESSGADAEQVKRSVETLLGQGLVEALASNPLG